MTYLQLTAHVFLLLFWMRLWCRPAQEFYFNPFLSGTARFIDGIIGFLRPALMLPERLTALALLVFFWAFQAMFFARFGEAWELALGLFHFAPPEETLPWKMQFAYSGITTAWFLLQAWTLYFLARLISAPNRANRAQEAFTAFMNPFSRLPLPLQPFVLLALHFALMHALLRTGAVPHTIDFAQEQITAIPELFAGGRLLTCLLRTGLLALDSFACGFETLVNTLMLFIFGGLIAMLFGMKLPALICQESIDVLMGRFARKPKPGGGFDFSPLIFFIVANIISAQLHLILNKLILLPLPQ